MGFLRKIKTFFERRRKQSLREKRPFNLNKEMIEQILARANRSKYTLQQRMARRRFLKAFLRTPRFQQLLKVLEAHAKQGTIEREEALGVMGHVYHQTVKAYAGAREQHPDIDKKLNEGLSKNPRGLHEILGYDPFPIGGFVDYSKPGRPTIRIQYKPDSFKVVIHERNKAKDG